MKLGSECQSYMVIRTFDSARMTPVVKNSGVGDKRYGGEMYKHGELGLYKEKEVRWLMVGEGKARGVVREEWDDAVVRRRLGKNTDERG